MTAPPAPVVAVLSLGGTIAMHADASGQHAELPASDASAAPAESGGIDAVPRIGEVAGTGDGAGTSEVAGIAVRHRRLSSVGSSSLTFADLAATWEVAHAEVAGGAAGVVVTHGTDTLEESAFLLERFWDLDAPLILTGAMRPANAPGADGPANLADAVRAAADPAARGLGVLACLDGELHLADRVTKRSSRSVGAFASEPAGPIARVDAAGIRLLHGALPRRARTRGPVAQLARSAPVVPQIALGIGDDGAVLDQLIARSRIDSGRLPVDGVVVVGTGMGHVPAAAVARVRRLTAAGVPVVVATRVSEGGTSERHYAYPGSEADLLAHGAIMAGMLSPHTARLLLQVLLAEDADTERIREGFAAFRS